MPPLQLTDEDLPEIFKVADRASLRGQRSYLRGTKARLTFAILTAVFSALNLGTWGHWDSSPLCVTLALILTLLVEVWMLVTKPEREWYDGRAYAESVKSLSWRYAVVAEPFPDRGTQAEQERNFATEIAKLISESPSDSVVVTSSASITESMRRLRQASLAERRAIYIKERIENQSKWYSEKARHNINWARRWRAILLAIEGAGIIFALLEAGHTFAFDAAGVVGALLGAGSAWFAVRQYESLGRAYTFAANDLNLAHARLRHVAEENAWAREASDAEEAISREHTMWRASRGAL
jgi:hypothetical protein